MLKKLGIAGALLTCPCHAGLVLLLLGGTTAGAWLTANMGLTFGIFTAAFVLFLWLAARPERAAAADGPVCDTCAPDAGSARGGTPVEAPRADGRSGVGRAG